MFTNRGYEIAALFILAFLWSPKWTAVSTLLIMVYTTTGDKAVRCDVCEGSGLDKRSLT